MTKYLTVVSLLFSSSLVFGQNCDAIKAENKKLKAEIALLRYSTKDKPSVGGTTSASGNSSIFAAQTQADGNLTFRVTNVVGSKVGQTVTVTVLVTNKGANLENYSTQVSSFVSDEGETFACTGAEFGKEKSRQGLTLFATLYTNVPLKTTYLFEGVLPKITKIKLISLPYYDRLGALTGKVEFRDLPITWR